EEALLLPRLPHQVGDRLEPGRPQQPRDAVRGELAGGRDLVVERLREAAGVVGRLEAEQQVAARRSQAEGRRAVTAWRRYAAGTAQPGPTAVARGPPRQTGRSGAAVKLGTSSRRGVGTGRPVCATAVRLSVRSRPGDGSPAAHLGSFSGCDRALVRLPVSRTPRPGRASRTSSGC